MGLFARTKSIALVSVLIAGFLLVAYGFLTQYIVKLNTSAAELTATIQTEVERDRQLRSLERLLGELKSEESGLDNRFIKPEGEVVFLELLEQIARDAKVGLEVASVSLQLDPEENRPFEWIKLAFRADGSWNQLFHFLMLLETAPYVIKLDQVGLAYEAKDAAKPGAGGMWRGQFIIRVAKFK